MSSWYSTGWENLRPYGPLKAVFKVDIKSSTGVVYVGVVISNVMGGCPVMVTGAVPPFEKW